MFDAIIDPTVGPAASSGSSERGPAALAARPASLSGLRLGLLANTKRNAEEFLTQVGRELAEQYGVQTVLAAKKPDIGVRARAAQAVPAIVALLTQPVTEPAVAASA